MARSSRLTGMDLVVQEGRLGSVGQGLLQGETGGPEVPVSPRLVVTDADAEPLGRYKSDGACSAAQIRPGKRRSIFVGDMGPSWRLLAHLFERVGVHLWTRDGEVVQTDGKFLMVHSGPARVKPITLPEGVEAEPIRAQVLQQTGRILFVGFQEGETVWFRLHPASP